ncbi:MFS transporter [Thermoplasma sp. Kam2015]|uniref:MFS transporter n=1 Tax=Thermoplasma sp. Kam2015 TaxID=2094122 RepID=UPI000D89735D|nr:MFS transporter [Thermoplasma sp. Kam2015]PYB67630.1 MFS transporter [Thermoplasma sp. Kam2015]
MVDRLRNIPGVMIPFLFSAFSVFSISMVVPQIAGQFAVPISSVLLAIPLDFIGGAIGGLLLGYAADRYGRRLIMLISSAIFGIFTMASSFSTSIYMIYAFWFLIGLGVNAQNGVSYPVVVETLRRSSGTIGGIMQSLYFLGFMLDSVLFVFFHYWRTYLMVAGLIALVFSIPSAAMIMETGGRRIVSVHEKDPNFMRYTVAFSFVVIGAFMFSIPLMADVPTLLSDLKYSPILITVLSLAGFSGFVIAGFLSDRYRRGHVAMAFAGSGVLFSLALLLTHADAYLLAVLTAIYISSGFFSFSGIWVSENYPPGSRALATNIVFFSGRIVGGFSPFIAALIDPSSIASGIAVVCIISGLMAFLASAYIQAIKSRRAVHA